MKTPSVFWWLLLFILGWATQTLSLFDVGRYSFPLMMFVGLPFCIRATYRSTSWLTLSIASGLFATLVGVLEGAQTSHVVSQAVLQVLAIAFAAGIASIRWERHWGELERAFALTGVPIVLYACYQMVARVAHLPGAFLPVTNKQYYIDGGLQRDWDKPGVTRASSVFSEPSELGFFCLWLLVIGLSTKNTRLKVFLLVTSWVGILVSQSLSAFLGAVLIGIAYVAIEGISQKTIRQAVVGLVLCGAVIAVAMPLAPEAFDSFFTRVHEAVTFDDRADSGRVDHLPACMAIFEESPVWGHGISSLAAAGSDGADVTTVNYVMVLMERGAVGAALYFLPWFLLLGRAWAMPRRGQARLVSCLLLVMTLYSFCNFSLTYFLPFWMAFGIAASLVLGTYTAPRAMAARERAHGIALPLRG